jgi:hypothetical protein
LFACLCATRVDYCCDCLRLSAAAAIVCCLLSAVCCLLSAVCCFCCLQLLDAKLMAAKAEAEAEAIGKTRALVRQNNNAGGFVVHATVYTKNDHFAKTGSGQTYIGKEHPNKRSMRLLQEQQIASMEEAALATEKTR